MSLLSASIYFASTAPLICLYVSNVSRFACLRQCKNSRLACLRQCKKWPPDSPDGPKHRLTQRGGGFRRILHPDPPKSAQITGSFREVRFMRLYSL